MRQSPRSARPGGVLVRSGPCCACGAAALHHGLPGLSGVRGGPGGVRQLWGLGTRCVAGGGVRGEPVL